MSVPGRETRATIGVLQAVDRVGPQPQQAGAVAVDPGDSARLPECFLGAVHPFADRMASPGMQLTVTDADRSGDFRAGAGLSAGSGGQGGDDNVVDVRMAEAVRAAVVLEGGDHPALGLDRGEPGQACGLKELERLVVR